MKNVLRFFSLAVVISLVACNKDDDDNNNNPSNESQIVGAWTGVSLESHTYNPTTNDTMFSFTLPGGFNASFDANGNYTATALGDTETGTYTVGGNMITMYSEDDDTLSYNITTLNSGSLVLENEEIDGEYKTEERLEFSR